MDPMRLMKSVFQRIASLPHTVAVGLGLQKASWFDDEERVEQYRRQRRGHQRRLKRLHRIRRQRGQNAHTGKK